MMSQTVVKQMMMLLLVGPPVLCRAGVLVECCEHEQAEPAADATRSSCCDCDEDHGSNTGGRPPAREAPRKCGGCVAVCFGVTKPSDDSASAILVGWALLHLCVASESPLPQQTIRHCDGPRHLQNLPFPPSDIPLLV
ncbi:MAG: hypothetical protein PVI86_13245 [Phycisphaerae bacterium]